MARPLLQVDVSARPERSLSERRVQRDRAKRLRGCCMRLSLPCSTTQAPGPFDVVALEANGASVREMHAAPFVFAPHERDVAESNGQLGGTLHARARRVVMPGSAYGGARTPAAATVGSVRREINIEVETERRLPRRVRWVSGGLAPHGD